MIKYTTFINTQITSSNKNCMMHPTGISLYFTFYIFYTILCTYLNTFMHILKEINRINQIEVNKPNKDCMTGVNALNELFYFTHTLCRFEKNVHYSFPFRFSNRLIISTICRPDSNQVMTYGFGSQQFNDMPSRFFISNRFLVGDC